MDGERVKKINFGCGEDRRAGFLNVDYPEVDLNQRTFYRNKEFDYGLCRCVVPYLNDINFSIKEMRRVCKELEVSFPYVFGSPNQLKYGRVNYSGFTLRQLLQLKPNKIRIEFYNYVLFKRFCFDVNNKKMLKLALYWDVYLSAIIRARNIWLTFND